MIDVDHIIFTRVFIVTVYIPQEANSKNALQEL